MLRTAVDSRKNGIITNVLSCALQKQASGTNGVGNDVTDSRTPICRTDRYQVIKKL